MSFLAQALIFLAAAITIVPVCNRLGLNSVLGYLLAGVLIGQAGLGLVGDAEGVLHFAEIGVVLLLFVIGLELQPSRLWVMRHLVFGLGSLQVLVTTGVIAALLLPADLGAGAALLLGFALALSSTAFVLQLLAERKQQNEAHGRAAFGVLLLQDVAVIPAIAVVNLLAQQTDPSTAPLRPALILAVTAGVVAARFLLRPLLRFIAASGIQELFTAAALALVVGAALAMEQAGLSMGLGAFIAGMVVADSGYRHQLEADVNPFKGLLLGLFFMAVGMSVDVGLLIDQPARILGLTAALIAVKTVLLAPLARWHGLTTAQALRTAILLSQGGEFAFVLLTTAVTAGLMAPDIAATAVLVVTLSMVTTPLLSGLADRWLGVTPVAPPVHAPEPAETAVVVAGFGRVGQIVARVLTTRHIPFTALEINPHQVDFVRQFGNRVFYGDASRLDLLRTAGVPRARALVVAVGNQDASLKIVDRVRASCPGLVILARATTRHHELLLRDRGVDYVLRDTLHSSLVMASELLEQLGLSPEEARQVVDQFREHDELALTRQAAVLSQNAGMRSSERADEELQRLFAEDAILASDPTEDHPSNDRPRTG